MDSHDRPVNISSSFTMQLYQRHCLLLILCCYSIICLTFTIRKAKVVEKIVW